MVWVEREPALIIASLCHQHTASNSPGERWMHLPRSCYCQDAGIYFEEPNLLGANPGWMPSRVDLDDEFVLVLDTTQTRISNHCLEKGRRIATQALSG